jgi:hypothetical protein
MTSRADSGIPRQEPERTTTEAKPARFADTVRRQFREVMKHLTGTAPEPQPQRRRRRTEDTGRGFRMAAMNLMRRTTRPLISRTAAFMWDTLTWLHLWEWNATANSPEVCDDVQHTEQHPLSPHP